jgi:sigma54-dependent transcription regulator
MHWDEGSWNRHLRNVRSSLVKRDAFAGGGKRPRLSPFRDEAERERRAWSAKARANLKRLAALARQAPDRQQAEETVRELLDWYESPPD